MVDANEMTLTATENRALNAYEDLVGEEYAREHFEEAFRGQFRDRAEFAEQFAWEIGALENPNKWPANHVDWESAAEELGHDYDYVDAPNGGVFVFRVI